MKKLLIAVVVGVFVVLASSASASPIELAADPILIPDEDGNVTVHVWSKDKPSAKFWATDADGKRIEAPNWPLKADDAGKF